MVDVQHPNPSNVHTGGVCKGLSMATHVVKINFIIYPVLGLLSLVISKQEHLLNGFLNPLAEVLREVKSVEEKWT